MRTQGLRLLGLLVLVMAGLIGVTVANAQDSTVNVELNEWNVIPDVSSVAAGDIEFVATNTGSIEHELIVVQTDLAPDALPVSGGRVDESGAGLTVIGEIPEFAAGGTESASFDLEAGDYVLICNIAGHYEAGMSAAFTVTAAGGGAAPTVVSVPGTGIEGIDSGGGFPVLTVVAALAAAGGLALAAGVGWVAYRGRREHGF